MSIDEENEMMDEIWKNHFASNGCLSQTFMNEPMKKAIRDAMWEYSRKYSTQQQKVREIILPTNEGIKSISELYSKGFTPKQYRDYAEEDCKQGIYLAISEIKRLNNVR